jgi:hypothetical protein
VAARRKGQVQHWKHGWIPVSPEAKAYVAGKGPNPTPGTWKPVGLPYQHLRRNFGHEGDVFPGTEAARLRKLGLQAEIEKNGGFTYDPNSGGLLKVGEAKGFAVAVPGTEEIVGEEKVNADDISREDFARGVANVLMKHRDKIANGAVLGGWYSPERNQYMVELTEIMPPYDRDAAIQAGRDRNQEAIFDLATGETIFTGGTGDVQVPNDARELTEREPVLALSAPTEPLTREEQAAAKYYTGPGFVPLNGALRRGEPLTPQVDFYRQRLDSAIAKSVVQRNTTVYRGLSSGPWLTGNPPGFRPGDLYADSGYMSTAISDGPPDNYKADVMMQIEVPQGTHALDLVGNRLSHHSEEKELLLAAGSRLRILSDTYQFDQRVIHAEVVNDG